MLCNVHHSLLLDFCSIHLKGQQREMVFCPFDLSTYVEALIYFLALVNNSLRQAQLYVSWRIGFVWCFLHMHLILPAYSLNKFKYFLRIRRRICVPQTTASYSLCTLKYFPSILHRRLNTFRIFSEYAERINCPRMNKLRILFFGYL